MLTKTMVSHSSVIYLEFEHDFLFIRMPRVCFSPFGVYIGMCRESVVTTIDKTDSNKQATDFAIAHKVGSLEH